MPPHEHRPRDPHLSTPTGKPRAGAFTPGAPAANTPHDKAARYDQLSFIPWGYLDPFYEAVVRATEEAVVNSLTAAEEMTGRDGHRSPALPRDRMAAIAARASALYG
jgi:L-aminopeptidase/D-esterase-like protein